MFIKSKSTLLTGFIVGVALLQVILAFTQVIIMLIKQ